MAIPLSVPTTRILEVLADGEWHDRDELLDAAAKAVAPGRAFRVGERLRNRAGHRPNGPGPRVRGDDATSISTGARSVARSTLEGLIRHSHVERDGDRVRLVRPSSTVINPA